MVPSEHRYALHSLINNICFLLLLKINHMAGMRVKRGEKKSLIDADGASLGERVGTDRLVGAPAAGMLAGLGGKFERADSAGHFPDPFLGLLQILLGERRLPGETGFQKPQLHYPPP